jgi:hypothetical protein
MGEKSNKGGRLRPLVILVSGRRNSSKKGCVMASMAVNRDVGVYSSNRAIISNASGVARDRNTYIHMNKSYNLDESKYEVIY